MGPHSNRYTKVNNADMLLSMQSCCWRCERTNADSSLFPVIMLYCHFIHNHLFPTRINTIDCFFLPCSEILRTVLNAFCRSQQYLEQWTMLGLLFSLVVNVLHYDWLKHQQCKFTALKAMFPLLRSLIFL